MSDAVEVERLLECAECGRPSVLGAAGWRALWTDEEPPAVVVFCPECAKCEFVESCPEPCPELR